MEYLRAAELTLAVALAGLCCVVGFTTPPVGNTAMSGLVSQCNSHTPVSAIVSQNTVTLDDTRTAINRRRMRQGLGVLLASDSSGDDDDIDEYKRQMADFMAQAHEKRLQAMETVKAEVQRGYEEQIAELTAKLSGLKTDSASAEVVAAPIKVPGVVAAPIKIPEPAPIKMPEPAPVVVGNAGGKVPSETMGSMTSIHSAYAVRSERPGWEARWGEEEVARASTVSTADVTSMEARVAEVTSSGGNVNSAYAARSERPGWEARWGNEEVLRTSAVPSADSTPTEARAAEVAPISGDVHPAYVARFRRPGWELRWGNEEMARAGGTISADLEDDTHPAYAARTQRPGWDERWGSEEPARMAGSASVSSAAAVLEPAPKAEAPIDHDPAYSARLQRPGWEARWGDEEKNRVPREPAKSAVPVEELATSSVERDIKDDPLQDSLLPDDVSELKSMIISYRRHFENYLVKSLESSNQLKQSEVKLGAKLSSAKVDIAEEEELRKSLQESFLGYMSRSADAGSVGKARISHLESRAAHLTAEAAELQRFTQEYMVKASSDKQKAVEDAVSLALVESGERIAALQAQVLELQAGG